jgi:hypothetical protein
MQGLFCNWIDYMIEYFNDIITETSLPILMTVETNQRKDFAC